MPASIIGEPHAERKEGLMALRRLFHRVSGYLDGWTSNGYQERKILAKLI